MVEDFGFTVSKVGFRAKGLRIGLLRLSCRAYGILGCRILGFRIEIVRAPMWYMTTIDSWCVRTRCFGKLCASI